MYESGFSGRGHIHLDLRNGRDSTRVKRTNTRDVTALTISRTHILLA